jgi:hypothetical protein
VLTTPRPRPHHPLPAPRRAIAHSGILAGAKTAIAQGIAKGAEAVTDGAKVVKEHMVGKDEPQSMGEKVGAKVDEAADAAAKEKARAAEAAHTMGEKVSAKVDEAAAAASEQKAKTSNASGVDKLKEQLGGKGDAPKEAKESK